MKMKLILSVEMENPRTIEPVIEQVSGLVDGILLPTWDYFHLSAAREVARVGKEVWLNVGAQFTSQLRSAATSIARACFADPMFNEPVFPTGIIIYVGERMIHEAHNTFNDGVRSYTKVTPRHGVPKDWQPPLYTTAAITTKAEPEHIMERVLHARDCGFAGIVTPYQYIARIKEQTPNLTTIVTAIRNHDFPVIGDDQIITCIPEQARDSGADYGILGRSITQAPTIDEMNKRLEYFLAKLQN